MSILIGFVVLSLFALAPTASIPQESARAAGVRAGSTHSAASRCDKCPIDDVSKIAVYAYSGKANELLRPENRSQIRYTIIEPEDVNLILEALSYKERNGSEDLSSPNAYVFFSDSSGKKFRSGKIVGGWQYLMLDDNWKALYPIPERGSQLLRERKQFCTHLSAQQQ